MAKGLKALAGSKLLNGLAQGYLNSKKQSEEMELKKQMLKLEQDKLKIAETEGELQRQLKMREMENSLKMRQSELDRPFAVGESERVYQPSQGVLLGSEKAKKSPIEFKSLMQLGDRIVPLSQDTSTGEFIAGKEFKMGLTPDEGGKLGASKGEVDKLSKVFGIISKFSGREDLISAVMGAKTPEERASAIGALNEIQVPEQFRPAYEQAILDLNTLMGLSSSTKSTTGGGKKLRVNTKTGKIEEVK